MRFYPSAAAAQQAGFRACKRCRPDASPGSPEWNERADLVARAMRLIADGVVDRDGVPGLAARLGYSARQVERQLLAELGAGPLALARAQRAQTARLLIETTALPMGDVAFAAGFASIRTFNDTVREVFALSPTELRRRAGRGPARPPPPARCRLRLPFRAPLCPGQPVRAPGRDRRARRRGVARRRLPAHAAPAARPRHRRAAARDPTTSAASSPLTDLRDLAIAISRCRRLLDLDADPVAVDDLLARRPGARARWSPRHPGRRVPRTVDGAEFAVRAVLGQQVSTAAARTHAGRLVTAHGEPVDDPAGGLTHLFPDPAALAGLDPADAGHAAARRATLAALAARAGRRRRSTSAPAATGQRGPGAARRAARHRAVDGRDDRDARARRPRRLPAHRPRASATPAARLGLPATPAALTRHAAALAALARLRGPVPVGHRRPPHQPASGRA